MNDIEALRREQEEKLQTAILENEIAVSMPVTPKRVTCFSMNLSCPWVTYEVDTLLEAIELASSFYWITTWYAKNGCAVVRPEELLGEYEDHKELSFDAPYLDLRTVNTRIFSSELCFYTRIADRLLKVCISIKRHPSIIRVSARYNKAFDSYSDIVKDYPSLHEDKRICWGTGGEASASATYHWGTAESFTSAMGALLLTAPGKV